MQPLRVCPLAWRCQRFVLVCALVACLFAANAGISCAARQAAAGTAEGAVHSGTCDAASGTCADAGRRQLPRAFTVVAPASITMANPVLVCRLPSQSQCDAAVACGM